MSQDLKQLILKSAGVSTGVAGFILGAIPITNGVGGWLIGKSESFIQLYEKSKIKNTSNLTDVEAKNLFTEIFNDENFSWSPKICIALALKAGEEDSHVTKELLDHVNEFFYEGVGEAIFSGEKIVLNDDIEEVRSIMDGTLLNNKKNKAPKM